MLPPWVRLNLGTPSTLFKTSWLEALLFDVAYHFNQDVDIVYCHPQDREILVPHELSFENWKQWRNANIFFFFHCIVTGDEKCVLHITRKWKTQWLSQNEKPVSTPKSGLYPQKSLFCVWWNMKCGSVMSYWNMEQPSLQMFSASNLIG